MDAPEYLIRAADHTLSVLDLVVRDGEVRVRNVAEVLGIAPSSAHRLLATLAHRDYLVQDPISRIYRPGARLLRLGLADADAVQVGRAARAHMVALAEATNESVSLSVLRHGEVEFVEGVESRHVLRAAPRIGARLPAYATAGGKVQLADLPAGELAALYGPRLRPVTDATITSLAELRTILEAVRERGYATSREESTEGICAVAVPVRGPGGRYLAGLAVVAPAARLTDRHVQPLISGLRATAADIGRDLAAPAGRRP